MSKMSKIDQNAPKGCNAMYAKDIKDGKRTYRHILLNTIFDVFDIHTLLLIFYTTFHTCIEWYVCYVSQHLQHQTMCIDMHPLMTHSR